MKKYDETNLNFNQDTETLDHAAEPMYWTTNRQAKPTRSRWFDVIRRFEQATGKVVNRDTVVMYNYGSTVTFRVDGEAIRYIGQTDSADPEMFKIYADVIRPLSRPRPTSRPRPKGETLKKAEIIAVLRAGGRIEHTPRSRASLYNAAGGFVGLLTDAQFNRILDLHMLSSRPAGSGLTSIYTTKGD